MTASCAPIGVDTVVAGRTPKDVLRLAGEWTGEYVLPDGRAGHMRFSLEPEAEKASGSVALVPSALPAWYSPHSHPAPVDEFGPRLAAIRSLHIDGTQVSGTLTPFWDAERSCDAWVIFLGQVRGDMMSGHYFSTCADGVRQVKGEWSATRRR